MRRAAIFSPAHSVNPGGVRVEVLVYGLHLPLFTGAARGVEQTATFRRVELGRTRYARVVPARRRTCSAAWMLISSSFS